MKVNLNRCRQQGTIYGAGICAVMIHGGRYYGMAVKAGEVKKIVRIMAARRWLVEHGCSSELAREVVSRALSLKN